MKLAEALALRASTQRQLFHLHERAEQHALYQEGEEPAEDSNALIAEYDRMSAELEQLIVAINTRNLIVELSTGITLTAALAQWDILRHKHRLRAEVANAAARPPDRYSRSEIRRVPAVNVRELRAEADELSRRIRELDTRIQEVNWLTEL